MITALHPVHLQQKLLLVIGCATSQSTGPCMRFVPLGCKMRLVALKGLAEVAEAEQGSQSGRIINPLVHRNLQAEVSRTQAPQAHELGMQLWLTSKDLHHPVKHTVALLLYTKLASYDTAATGAVLDNLVHFRDFLQTYSKLHTCQVQRPPPTALPQSKALRRLYAWHAWI